MDFDFDPAKAVFSAPKQLGMIKFCFANAPNGDALYLRTKACIKKVWEGGKASLALGQDAASEWRDVEEAMLEAAGIEEPMTCVSCLKKNTYLSVKTGEAELCEGDEVDVIIKVTGMWKHATAGTGLSLRLEDVKVLSKGKADVRSLFTRFNRKADTDSD